MAMRNSVCLIGIILLGTLSSCGTAWRSQSDERFDDLQREIERMQQEVKLPTGEGERLGNIYVEVKLLSVAEENYRSIEGLFSYADAGLVVAANPEVFAKSGLVVGVSKNGFAGQLRLAEDRLSSYETVEMFLVLADGASGYISVGKEIAVPRFFYHGAWYSGVEYEFVQAGRAMEVTARRVGEDKIEMQLVPTFSMFGHDGELEFTELSTTVVAGNGQSVVIGGGKSQGEDVATALLSYRKTNKKMRTVIVVTPILK